MELDSDRDEGGAPAHGTAAARPEPVQGERFFGRRHGRKLRPARRRLLATLLPRLAITLPPAPGGIAAPIAPATWFARPTREVWLEIGFGAGEHLIAQVRRHPDIGFIGCDPFVNGTAALLAAVGAAPPDNLRIYPDDARALLPHLADASIGRIFLLFPDPWPKARHAERRFIGAGTAAALAHVLADGGELRIATDAPEYARWVLGQLGASPDLAWAARCARDWRQPPPDWVETRYQQKARAAGRPAIHLTFLRAPRPAPPREKALCRQASWLYSEGARR